MTNMRYAIPIFQALPQRDDADKMEKHMFRVYDANDDGYVDFVEFMVNTFLYLHLSLYLCGL